MGSDSLVTEDAKIYDLTDVCEERNGRNNQEVIVIDGRGYEKSTKNKDNIFDLKNVVADSQTANNLNEEIIKQAKEIIEKIAREIIPEIAERIIREEIEKLKKTI